MQGAETTWSPLLQPGGNPLGRPFDAPADSFYNDGKGCGSLKDTPLVDSSAATCPTQTGPAAVAALATPHHGAASGGSGLSASGTSGISPADAD